MAITIDKLRKLSLDKSFKRGINYYENDLVNNPVKLKDTIMAEVSGSSYPYYEVEMNINNPAQNYCSCPYDWGGICKHKIALGLKWFHEPESFNEIDKLDSYKPIDYDNPEIYINLDMTDLICILNNLINDNKGIILDILEYRKDIDKMNTELFNFKAKLLKDLIIEDFEKYILESTINLRKKDDFYDRIHILIDILNYQFIIEELRMEIIDDFLEILFKIKCPEEDLIYEIIKSSAKNEDEIDYIVEKVKNDEYKSSKSFIKLLKE